MGCLTRFYLNIISILSFFSPIFAQDLLWFEKAHLDAVEMKFKPLFEPGCLLYDAQFGDYHLTETSYKKCQAITALAKSYYEKQGLLSQTESDIAYCLGSYHFWEKVLSFLSTNPGYKDVIQEAIKHERCVNNSGGLVLYHVISPVNYVFDYIDTALYGAQQRLMAGKIVAALKHPCSMLILRSGLPKDTNSFETLKKYKNPPLLKDASDGYERIFSLEYDQNEDNSPYLLSCTGSLFGCFLENGSSTYDYWRSDTVSFDQDAFLRASFIEQYPSLSISPEKQQDLIHCMRLFTESNLRGVLLQLCFTDKALLDEVSYVAHPGGFGYGPVMIEGIEYNTTSTVLTLLLQGNLGSCDGACESVVIEPGILKIHNAAQEADRINSLQYRLILTDDLLLNPSNERISSNFSVKAYVEHAHALATFHTAVDAIVESIMNALL